MSKYRVHADPLEPGAPAPDNRSGPGFGAMLGAARRWRPFGKFRVHGLPDIRSGVLDDLSSYFKVDAEACIYRARHSYELSAKEWLAGADRSSEEGIADFALHLNSYIFGTLWYAYLQAEGYAYPPSVVIARDLASWNEGHAQSSKILDFGSGAGVTGRCFTFLATTCH